jgi:hypothetical protein
MFRAIHDLNIRTFTVFFKFDIRQYEGLTDLQVLVLLSLNQFPAILQLK